MATHKRSPGPSLPIGSLIDGQGLVWTQHEPHTDLERFSAAIVKTLVAYGDKQLFIDDQMSLTGVDAMELMGPLKDIIQDLTPARGRVGIGLQNSTKAAVAFLATIVSGRVPVMIPPTSDGLPLPKLLHAVILPEGDIPAGVLDIPAFYIGREGQIAQVGGLRRLQDKPVPRNDTLLILFTSGSSGEPKGVELSAQALQYTIETITSYFGLSEETVAAISLPLFHTMALNTQFLPTFFAGGRSVFIDSRFGLGKLYRSIMRHDGTFVSLIGDMLQLCMEEKARRMLVPAFGVTDVQLAGGIIRPEHLDMALELFPNAKIHKGYGLTEGIRVAMISSADPHFYTDAVGRILPKQKVIIVDEQRAIVPTGQMGQILVRGPNVMLGYDGIEDPETLPGGYLPTGDVGYMTHDGYLMVQGRVDGIFKTQGRRVAAKEIELFATKSPDVRDAKALPIPCIHKGLRPILFVEVAKEGRDKFKHETARNLLEEILARNLETYKLPRDIFICPELPRGATGKIRARKLEQVWDYRERATLLGVGRHGCRFHYLSQFIEGNMMSSNFSQRSNARGDGK